MKGERDQAGVQVCDLDQEVGEAYPVDGKESDAKGVGNTLVAELAEALWVELSPHKEGN